MSRRSRSPRPGYRERPRSPGSRNERDYRDEPRRDDRRRHHYDQDDRGPRERRHHDEDRGGRSKSGRDERRDFEDETRLREQDRPRGSGSRRSRSPRDRPRQRSRSVSRPTSTNPEPEKGKPNFERSGLLAAETKTVAAADGTKTVLKYHEPPEARKPLIGWRLYVFKGDEQVDLLHIQRQSAYLVGRDRTVVDIPIEHPSCSKQHAVIQYRYIQSRDEFGDVKGTIKPYIIDLESTNGTTVNKQTIPPAKYYELQANDVIKFGDSLREYVLLHDESS